MIDRSTTITQLVERLKAEGGITAPRWRLFAVVVETGGSSGDGSKLETLASRFFAGKAH